MASVVTIASQKGGVSKSTLAINLAAEATRQKLRAIILEVDRQGTSSSWAEKRDGKAPEVWQVAGHQLEAEIAKASKKGAKVVIIDVPGAHGPSVKWAIRNSDFVLIPSRPNGADLEATVETRRTIADEAKPCAYVLTFTTGKTGPHVAVSRQLATLGELVAPPIPQLKTFPDATDAGQSVFERDPEGTAAASITALWDWLASQLKLAKRKVA